LSLPVGGKLIAAPWDPVYKWKKVFTPQIQEMDPMDAHQRSIAAADLVLISPAVLFMIALLVRLAPPSVPAQAAQAIVTWYSDRNWTLWVLLFALPLAALVIGGAALFRQWKGPARRRPAARVIAVETLASLVILAIVAVHVMMN
jgi:hypothetical protein